MKGKGHVRKLDPERKQKRDRCFKRVGVSARHAGEAGVRVARGPQKAEKRHRANFGECPLLEVEPSFRLSE